MSNPEFEHLESEDPLFLSPVPLTSENSGTSLSGVNDTGLPLDEIDLTSILKKNAGKEHILDVMARLDDLNRTDYERLLAMGTSVS